MTENVRALYVSDDGVGMIQTDAGAHEFVNVESAVALGLVSRADIKAARKSTAADKNVTSLSDYLEERAQSGEQI